MKDTANKYRYLYKNTAIFAVSSFSTKILSFLFIPIYTAVLTTTEYGTADLINTTGILLIYILTVNIADSVLRFSIEKVEDSEKILSFGIKVLFTGTIICALLLGLACYVELSNWPVIYYVFIFLFFVSSAFYQIMTNYLRGIDKVSAVAVSGVISSGVIIGSNILFLVVIKVGILGYLISMVTGPIVASIYCIFAAKKTIRQMFFSKLEKATQIGMLKYCMPLIFNNIALWINGSLDKYFVTGICGTAETGIYSVAGKIPHILDTCIIVFCQAWNLSAIKEFDPEDKDGFFSKTYNVYGAVMAVGCSMIIIMNIPLARFLYSDDFFIAWRYSSILVIATMFNTLTAFIGSIFSAARSTHIIATTTILSAVINTILNIILIPKLGPSGAAIATVIAYFAMWQIRLLYLKKIMRLNYNFLKNIVTYALLVLQVIFEHHLNHFYVGQIMCVCFLMIINLSELKMVAKKLLSV
ncbi:polysaccharide biosynthesis C-terminal domain-containing protein [Enterocloster bolteae]|jgi:O-antigen/teichoic acid export membrane protein|uniref:oligosaccharide flippase family protein n=1 Tax=Clostridia TaxID=186801 RepID=UPI001106BA5D|nr:MULTISPECIES: polysaccharide biosynthesis C-terminal domain-containing protein [Clostridia]MCB7093013.1 polysaccharide biosynthesis C-terminal domain-containing protein [Enterocloster bolteae]MCH1938344.1 polysaccharide biosynthesis C-terminal domain-containing protein [Enterocloster sp. OA11]